MTDRSVVRSDVGFSPFTAVSDMWSISTADYVTLSGIDGFARYKDIA